MDEDSIQPILEELFSSVEPLDAQSSAALQFLKAKGIATDEELAPFLEQASNAASVRWRAVRIRAAAMIANLVNPPQQEPSFAPAEKDRQQAAPGKDQGQGPDQQEPGQENSSETEEKEEEDDESEPESTGRREQGVTNERKAPNTDDAENAA